MSIIQEALKKAQDYIKDQKPSQKEKVEQPTHLEERTVREEAAVSKKRYFKTTPLLLTLFSILVIFAAKQFLLDGKLKLIHSGKIDSVDVTAHQEITYKPMTPKMELEPNANPITGLQKSYGGQFILNGIMYLNDGPQAIINNSVVMEGDTIGGAKVMKINKNNVVLNFNNLEITLSLKQ